MLISGEMNSTELNLRMLSAEARVPLHSVRIGRMTEPEWARLASTISAFADVPIHIGTPADFTMEDLSVEVAQLVLSSGLKLLMVDSLESVADRETSGSAYAESVLRRLKKLAETLKIPVIVTAHAERFRERGGILTANPIDKLTHSAEIERIADLVILLHRPDQDELEHPRAGEADLIVAKNRNGPTAAITVAYQYHYSRFVNMVPAEYEIFPVAAPAGASATAHDMELLPRYPVNR
jgi:replicative DNA helicase